MSTSASTGEVRPDESSGGQYRKVAEIAAVAVLYFITARAGLLLAMPGGHVTPIYPPSGIALAALLCLGPRALVGIWLSAFLSNCCGFLQNSTNVYLSLFISAAMAFSGLTGPWAGCVFLKWMIGDQHPLERVKGVFSLMFLSGAAACMISPLFGVPLLCLTGFDSWSEFWKVWMTWWVGDAAGVFLLTPLLLAFCKPPSQKLDMDVHWLEKAACYVVLTAASWFVFFGNVSGQFEGKSLDFILIPILYWPSFRFGPKGSVQAMCLVAVLATWGTINQTGPFHFDTFNKSLLMLEIFLCLMAFSSLGVAAGVFERRSAEADRRAILLDLDRQVRLRTAELTSANVALIESESKFRALSEESLVGVYLIQDGRFKYVNEALARMHGSTRETLLNLPSVLETVCEEDRPRVIENIQRRLKGETQSLQYSFRGPRKDGLMREYEVLGSSTVFEGRPAILGTAKDVTEQSRAENELANSRSQLQAIFDNMTEAIAVIDSHTYGVIHVNPAVIKIHGINSSNMTAEQVMATFEVISPDGTLMPTDQWPMFRAIRGDYVRNFPMIIRRKDTGHSVDVDFNTAPILDKSGNANQIIMTYRDVSERNRIERALRVSETRYRRLVESNVMGIVISKLDGAILEANDFFLNLLGYSRTDFQAGLFRWDQLTPPEWRPISMRAADELRHAGACAPFEKEYFHKNGSRVPVQLTVARLDGAAETSICVVVDITARELSRKVLQTSEERYRLLAENTEDFVTLVEVGGKPVYLSPSFERRTGWTFEDLMTTDWNIRLLNEEMPTIIDAHEKNLRGVTTVIEHRLKCKNGKVIWVETNCKPLKDDAGNIVRLLVWSHDITERRRAADAMRVQEEQYRLLFDNNPHPMWVYETETLRYLAVNEAMVRHYGYSREELLNMTIRDIRPSEDVPALIKAVSNLPAGQFHLGTWQHRKKNGTIMLVDIYSNAITFAGKSARVGTSMDITERKRAEALLQSSEERYRRIVQTSAEGIWTIDAEGRTSFVNPKMAQMLGFTEDEMLNRPLDDFMDEEGRAISNRNIERRKRGIAEQHEFKFKRKDGSELWTQLATGPINDSEGKYLGALAMVTDITDRKRAEDEREKLLSDLRDSRERLGTASRQLILVQETERRNLARELHDEIGQLLTAISINLQVAKQAAGPSTVARIDDALLIVDRAVEQVRERSLSLRPSMLDDFGLAAALRWYVGRMEKSGKFKIHLTTQLGADRLPADVETASFRIIQEALTNAARHSKATDVWIEIDQKDSHIDIKIKDNGVGFNPSSARRKAALGSSVGLFGIIERVGLLNGQIHIDSSPGTGTEIRVRFNLVEEPIL